MDSQTNRKTDGQRDRQELGAHTDGWIDSCTDGRTDRCALGQYGQINRWTDSQTDDKVNKEIVF
jgi:hypothetical protein